MNDAFLDTVGLIAVWDTADQWHAAAEAAYRRLLSQGRRLVTTSFVLLECGNAAARRPYRRKVNELRTARRRRAVDRAHPRRDRGGLGRLRPG